MCHEVEKIPEQNFRMEDIQCVFEGFVGRDELKREVVSKLLRMKAFDGEPGFYAFVGNPGTGKTAMAMCAGRVCHKLGILKTDKVVSEYANGLLSDYANTTEKIRRVCEEALDGVLIVDEAHWLGSAPWYQEALYTLLDFAVKHAGRICVIFVGYPEPIQRLWKWNPGLYARTQVICFPDYTTEELVEIFEQKAKENNLELAAGMKEAAKVYLERACAELPVRHGNGRTAARLVKSCKFNMFQRIFEGDDSRRILLPEDIPENL